MLHPQINAHKESLPFLMSKKWEAVQIRTGFCARYKVYAAGLQGPAV
jgi:hypothetical protein